MKIIIIMLLHFVIQCISRESLQLPGLAEVGVFGFKPFDNFRGIWGFSFLFSLLFLGFSI